MATEAKLFLTPAEYLRIERSAGFKSEYHEGRTYAMAGGTANHSAIEANVIAELIRTLRESHCRTFTSNLRIHIPGTGLYTYADALVVCEEPTYLDDNADTLLNPTLIVEVLSPSTQNYDRGDKFMQYRSIPSLREYLIIAQDRMLLEQWSFESGHWMLTEHRASEAVVGLISMEGTLLIAEIYRNVQWPPSA